MKYCVNPACNAELEDYVERCPECGVLQKKTIMPKQPEVSLENEPKQQVAERHGFITFWLYLVIICNFFAAVINLLPKQMWGKNFPDSWVGFSVFVGILCIVNIVGVALLLSWKKSGFWIVFASSLTGNFISAVVMHSFPYGIVGLIVLWGILQIKKNGVSYWSALQ